MKKQLLALCGLMLAAGSASACFTVYNKNERIVYRGVDAPVDMSNLALQATVQAKFGPGSRMVFDTLTSCPAVRLAEAARPRGGDVPEGSVQWAKDVSSRPLPGSTED